MDDAEMAVKAFYYGQARSLRCKKNALRPILQVPTAPESACSDELPTLRSRVLVIGPGTAIRTQSRGPEGDSQVAPGSEVVLEPSCKYLECPGGPLNSQAD